MILQALNQLAEREGLVGDPDFEPKPVAWLVRISKEGKLLGIEGTHYTPPQVGKKKPKSQTKVFSVPREGGRTSGDRAFFAYDKSEYVFGQDPEKDEKKKRPQEKLDIRFSLFRDKIRECCEATKDEGAKAVMAFLDDVLEGKQTVELPEDCAGNDLFAFVYEPDVDRLFTERAKVRDYWKQLRNSGDGEGVSNIQCLVCGETLPAMDLFPSLKKVPGGTTSGVALVSFNSSAFESYGWKKNENAPVSRQSAESCSTALNRLLDPAYPDPENPGETLPKRNLRLSSDTVVCYWSAGESGDSFADLVAPVFEGNPEQVGEMYRSIWRGKKPDIEDPTAFYALTITGTQGRAIIRDWFESTVSDVAEKLAEHFADLDIVTNTPKPKKRDLPPQVPLSVLLQSLAPGGDSEAIPSPLVTQIVRSALQGTPYPFSALQRAVERARAEVGRDDWSDSYRRDARAALIKAVLNRRKRKGLNTYNYKEVQRDMDPNNSSEGYVLGRLMAVLERLQQEALQDVNASVIDKYFSGASASPKSVFVRLLKNARHHASKAKNNKGGYVYVLERLIDELTDRFDPKNNGFPAHLDIEQQGLFVLGYHQMRKWIWMNKEEKQAWRNQYPDAPSVYLGKKEEQEDSVIEAN